MSGDEAMLAAALARLADTGEIAYDGEYGCEIATFVPFAAWLKREGHLNGRRVVSYRGMRPYYFFLDEAEFAERDAARLWVPPGQRDWPGANSATAVASRWHVYPDYRAHYAPERLPERPILFVQNKFTIDWNIGPVNFIGLGALDRLFARTEGRFDVIYSRPGIARDAADYVGDGNTHCSYPDRSVAERHAHVRILEDMAVGGDYNRMKLELLAQARLFVAAQGGGAHLLACFGGSLMLLLHRAGEEYPHAYHAGAYKYPANPPPILLVARDFAQFDEALAVFDHVAVNDGRLTLAGEARPLLDRLRL